MNGTQKLMAAVVAVFALGFLMVGSNKEQSPQQQEDAAMVRAIAQMQRMANQKCP
ncbi:secreted protein, partial [methanotrophic bacterial endosymbiont of Bathymodiolus sp.]